MKDEIMVSAFFAHTTQHIANALQEELQGISVVAKFATTAIENYIERMKSSKLELI